MCSDSPDLSGVNDAARMSASLGQDALDFWKTTYADQQPLRDQAAATATRVANSQATAMDTATRLAEQANQHNQQFRAAESGMLRDALAFDTEGERERLAGMALGDVNQQFGSALEQTGRNLSRMGVNPNDGSYTGALKQITLAQALAGADAKNKARQSATQQAWARKMDALSLARGLPSQQATQQNIALNAGNSASGNAQVPVNVAQSGASMVGQGYGTAMQGYGQSGNLYGQAAQISGQSSGAGDFLSGAANLGMAGKYIFSDKHMKKDREQMDGEMALSMVRKMPVDSWRYKEGTPASDGGKQHVGPMAQDVHAAAGDAMAPGGEAIDLVSMNGMMLSSVQKLDKNVRKLDHKVMALSSARRPAHA